MGENDLEYEVIPGILEKEWDAIEQKIALVKSFAKTIHIDIIDGKFAPNTTWLDPKPFKKFSDEFFLEVHMMVDNPLQYVEPFAKAGFKRFLGHIEHMPSQTEFVAKAQELGEVGLAIDGPTSLEKLTVVTTDLDCVLAMTITAGKSGQVFEKKHLEKVLGVRSGDEFLPIEVDGGINDATIEQALEAGATRFVSTSFLFNADPKDQYEKLQKKIDAYLEKQSSNAIV